MLGCADPLLTPGRRSKPNERGRGVHPHLVEWVIRRGPNLRRVPKGKSQPNEEFPGDIPTITEMDPQEKPGIELDYKKEETTNLAGFTDDGFVIPTGQTSLRIPIDCPSVSSYE